MCPPRSSLAEPSSLLVYQRAPRDAHPRSATGHECAPRGCRRTAGAPPPRTPALNSLFFMDTTSFLTGRRPWSDVCRRIMVGARELPVDLARRMVGRIMVAWPGPSTQRRRTHVFRNTRHQGPSFACIRARHCTAASGPRRALYLLAAPRTRTRVWQQMCGSRDPYAPVPTKAIARITRQVTHTGDALTGSAR